MKGTKRTAMLHVRIYPWRMKRYVRIASLEGLTLSEWVRSVLDKKAAKEGHDK